MPEFTEADPNGCDPSDADPNGCAVRVVDEDDEEEDEDGYQGGLPDTYVEVEYSDFDNPEAVDGARFDDMNYLRYTER